MQPANGIPQRQPSSGLRLCLSTTTGFSFFSIQDVSYFEAAGNYSWLYAAKSSARSLITQSLCQLEEALDGSSFCRIHRSFIVNLSHVTQMEPDKTTLKLFTSVTLPLGRSYQLHFFGQLALYR